jgi:hypothetical protein
MLSKNLHRGVAFVIPERCLLRDVPASTVLIDLRGDGEAEGVKIFTPGGVDWRFILPSSGISLFQILARVYGQRSRDAKLSNID